MILSNKSNMFAIDPKTALVKIDVPPKLEPFYEKGLVFSSNNDSPELKRFLELVQENLNIE